MALLKFMKKLTICIGNIWLKKPYINQQNGAAAVEFAFAMIALFGFFAIYMQFVQFFVVHEKITFASFAASRTYAVKGSGAAIQVAGAIEPNAAVEIKKDGIELKRDVPIPKGIDRFLTGGQGRFTVKHRSPMFKEPSFNDDNPAPF